MAKDRYLYRAVDTSGASIDFLPSKLRMKGSAQKFLNKVVGNTPKPCVINIDDSGADTVEILTINWINRNNLKIQSITGMCMLK